jgi:hypothetical protein
MREKLVDLRGLRSILNHRAIAFIKHAFRMIFAAKAILRKSAL